MMNHFDKSFTKLNNREIIYMETYQIWKVI